MLGSAEVRKELLWSWMDWVLLHVWRVEGGGVEQGDKLERVTSVLVEYSRGEIQ